MSFQNCHIVGSSIDPAKYHAKHGQHPRGSAEFIMSPSSINAFARLPSRWVRGWNPPDSKSRQWGNLLDTLLLTPHLFAERYALQPKTYFADTLRCPKCGSISDSATCSKCKRLPREPFKVEKPWRYGSTTCDEWKAEQEAQHREIVAPELLTQCKAAIDRLFEPVNGDDTVRRWFDACDKQVLLEGQWLDEETGIVIPISALLDFVPHADSEFASCLGDLKTATTAQALPFQRHAFKWGYHRQAAFDMDFYNACTGEGRTTWCFIIQENFEPWEPNRAMYGQEGNMGYPGFVELGRKASYGGYEGILATYAKCLKHGRWPRYNDVADEWHTQGWVILTPEPFDAERCSQMPGASFQEPAETEEAPEDSGGLQDPDDVIP